MNKRIISKVVRTALISVVSTYMFANCASRSPAFIASSSQAAGKVDPSTAIAEVSNAESSIQYSFTGSFDLDKKEPASDCAVNNATPIIFDSPLFARVNSDFVGTNLDTVIPKKTATVAGAINNLYANPAYNLLGEVNAASIQNITNVTGTNLNIAARTIGFISIGSAFVLNGKKKQARGNIACISAQAISSIDNSAANHAGNKFVIYGRGENSVRSTIGSLSLNGDIAYLHDVDVTLISNVNNNGGAVVAYNSNINTAPKSGKLILINSTLNLANGLPESTLVDCRGNQSVFHNILTCSSAM